MISFVSKMLISFGIVLVFLGVLFALFGKIPFMGRLPGDIYIRKENFTFYFPLATSLLVSVVLSFLISFLGKK